MCDEGSAVPKTRAPRAERLQCLGQAAVYAARELHTVLQRIAASVDAAAQDVDRLSPTYDWSATLAALKRSRALVDMFLHYGTQRPPRLAPVVLRPVLARVAQVTRTAGTLARGPVQVQERYTPLLPTIRADEPLLEASLVSLASGMLHACAPGPSEPALACDLQLSASAAWPWVRITLRVGAPCARPAETNRHDLRGLRGWGPSERASEEARAALAIARASIEAQGGYVQWFPPGDGRTGADVFLPLHRDRKTFRHRIA